MTVITLCLISVTWAIFSYTKEEWLEKSETITDTISYLVKQANLGTNFGRKKTGIYPVFLIGIEFTLPVLLQFLQLQLQDDQLIQRRPLERYHLNGNHTSIYECSHLDGRHNVDLIH